MSLAPNIAYLAQAAEITQRVNKARTTHISQTGTSPAYVYLGAAERSALAMAGGSAADEVLGLRVVPVSLPSWLKVGR